MQSLDIGRALKYSFEDPEWVTKLLIGALLMFVGIMFSFLLVGLIPLMMLNGYVIAVARNVARDNDVPLPRWENFGELLADGFRQWVATFIWSLPLLILYIPLIIFFVLASSGDSDTLAGLAFLTTIICGLPAMAYGLFLALISPIITWQIAAEGSISAALDVRRVWQILRDNLGSVVIIALVIWGVNVLAQTLGMLICGVGIFVTLIWSLWVQGHLIGQLGRMAQGTPPAEVISPEPTF